MTPADIDALDASFEAIDEWRGDIVVRLAGRFVRIHVADRHVERLIEHAFGHLRHQLGAERPTLEVRVAVGDVPGNALSDEPSGAVGVFRLPGGGVGVHHVGRQLELYRPSLGIDLLVTAEAATDPELLSHPMAATMAAWALDHDLLAMHSAAVEVDGRGVLLIGASGAGKSTTAMACAAAGLGFLGDDLCLVDPRSRTVHSWYSTMKLFDDSASAIGSTKWSTMATNRLGKAVVGLSSADGIKLVNEAPLVALVVLDIDDGSGRRLIDLPRTEVMPAMRCTAVPLPGSMAPWLSGVATLAHALPAFRLPLGWHLDDVVAAIREAAARGSTT